MQSTTFRDWLAQRGCRLHTLERGHGAGHPTIAVEREGHRAELPPVGPHAQLDPDIIREICDRLCLDWTELPGPQGRV